MKAPIRVAFLFASRDIGGAERSMLRLIERTHPHTFACRVIVPAPPNEAFERAVSALGVPYHGLDPSDLIGLYGLFRDTTPDVVYVFGRFRTIPWAIVARIAGVRCVLAAERSAANRRSDVWARRLDRFFVTAYAANSHHAAVNLARIVGPSGPRTFVVPNGIDSPARTPLQAAPPPFPALLCIGKITPNKGQIVLLEAVRRLRQLWPELRATLVGRDFTGGRFFADAEARGLGDTYEHTGFVEDVRTYLRSASVVVLPSLQREGMPTSILEAMAAGVPVVASRLGGVSEVVADGGTGLLVPPGDPGALAAAIGRLLGDDALRSRLGSAAYEQVTAKFGLEAMVRSHAAIFETLRARTREPQRLAHVTTIAGSLRYLLLGQLDHLRAAGYAVDGISAPGPDVEVLRAHKIGHAAVAMTRRFTPIADAVSLWRLYRVMREKRYTIVHTHTPKPGLLGQLAARAARVPVVVNTIHGFYFHDDMKGLSRLFYIAIETLAARCSDLILFQNEEDVRTATDLGIAPPKKLRYLGNGIDLGRFDPARLAPGSRERVRQELGIDPEAAVVGFVGRLVREKGVADLVAAARIVSTRIPSVRFVFVGPVDEEKTDAVTAASAEGFNTCIFAGHRLDMPEMYAAMDVFALPSYREGFPRAPMEASAMGLPCVVTNVRGCRQAVTAGLTGLLVPPGDPAALAEALLTLLEDKAQATSLGATARRRALQEFDERVVFETVASEYERLLREKGISAPEAASTLAGDRIDEQERYAS